MVPRRRPVRDSGWMPALEFWPLAALVLAPGVATLAWHLLGRSCAWFLHLAPDHRYCSRREAVDWLLHQGGWWKLLLELAGFAVLAWCGVRESAPARADGDEPPAPHR